MPQTTKALGPYRIGIDAGSKTIKLVVLDEAGTIVYSAYQQHFSHVRETIIEELSAALETLKRTPSQTPKPNPKAISSPANSLSARTTSVPGNAQSATPASSPAAGLNLGTASSSAASPSTTPTPSPATEQNTKSASSQDTNLSSRSTSSPATEQTPEIRAIVGITGSAGIGLAQELGLSFVQEVVASTHAVKALFPQAKSIIELGGEDAKIVYLTGNLEQRMNASCAGGTGSFIESIAGMLGVGTGEIDALASTSSQKLSIASRCAVFAKTDVRAHLSAGVNPSDIAASALDAVVRQTLEGLACGRALEYPLVFLGGPFEHIPELVRRFRSYLNLSAESEIKPEGAHLFTALGTALLSKECFVKNDFPDKESFVKNDFERESFQGAQTNVSRETILGSSQTSSLPSECYGNVSRETIFSQTRKTANNEHSSQTNVSRETISLEKLIERVQNLGACENEMERLPALFANKAEYAAFKKRHTQTYIERTSLSACKEPLYLGIDAGSTAVKLVALTSEGKLAWSDYRLIQGDALKTSCAMLERFYQELSQGENAGHMHAGSFAGSRDFRENTHMSSAFPTYVDTPDKPFAFPAHNANTGIPSTFPTNNANAKPHSPADSENARMSFPADSESDRAPFAFSSKNAPYIAHATICGYGEELLRAGLGVDSSVVETLAHVKAAQRFCPDVSFVLDIGGQDIKALWVRKGHIANAVLNEACSSGCGAFLQECADALGMRDAEFARAAEFAHATYPHDTYAHAIYPHDTYAHDTYAHDTYAHTTEFSRAAEFAKSPVDLGAKCTVFMTSRVKQAQKAGVDAGNIAAGLSYSVVQNALFRVVGAHKIGSLGTRIVVSGGTFASDAVLRAFEKTLDIGATSEEELSGAEETTSEEELSGAEETTSEEELSGAEENARATSPKGRKQTIIRPDVAPFMGAIGAALIAMERAREASGSSTNTQKAPFRSTLIGPKALAKLEVTRTQLRCRACENACLLSVLNFGSGKEFESEELLEGEKTPRNKKAIGSKDIPKSKNEFGNEKSPGELKLFISGNKCRKAYDFVAAREENLAGEEDAPKSKGSYLTKGKGAPSTSSASPVEKRAAGARVYRLDEEKRAASARICRLDSEKHPPNAVALQQKLLSQYGNVFYWNTFATENSIEHPKFTDKENEVAGGIAGKGDNATDEGNAVPEERTSERGGTVNKRGTAAGGQCGERVEVAGEKATESDRQRAAQRHKARIGYIEALSGYARKPFWHTLLKTLGFSLIIPNIKRAKLSGSEAKALRSVPSESVCFAAKLSHVQLFDLAQAGAQGVFMPSSDRRAKCPASSEYASVLANVSRETLSTCPYEITSSKIDAQTNVSRETISEPPQTCFPYAECCNNVSRETLFSQSRKAANNEHSAQTNVSHETFLQNVIAENNCLEGEDAPFWATNTPGEAKGAPSKATKFVFISPKLDWPHPQAIKNSPEDIARLLNALNEFATYAGVPLIDETELMGAIDAGIAEKNRFVSKVVRANEQVLSWAHRTGNKAVILAGRPYHMDETLLHGIDKMLVDLGFGVLAQLGLREVFGRPKPTRGSIGDTSQRGVIGNADQHGMQQDQSTATENAAQHGAIEGANQGGATQSDAIKGAAGNTIENAVRSVRQHPLGLPQGSSDWILGKNFRRLAKLAIDHAELEIVCLQSFGCAFDAVSLMEARALLEAAGKPFVMLKIDEMTNMAHVRIRLRTLAEAYDSKTLTNYCENTARSSPGEKQKPNASRDDKLANTSHDADLANNSHDAMPESTSHNATLANLSHDATLIPFRGISSADINCALRSVPGDVCAVAAALCGHTIRLLENETPHEKPKATRGAPAEARKVSAEANTAQKNKERTLAEAASEANATQEAPPIIELPYVCKHCLVDALPSIVRNATGKTPNLQWVKNWPEKCEAKKGRANESPTKARQAAESKFSAKANLSPENKLSFESNSPDERARPRIGIVGNALLCFCETMNDNLVSFIESFGFDVALPKPELLYTEDVRYFDQLDLFAAQGVTHVIYLQSFGCLKGHIHAHGCSLEFARRYPNMPITIIDYDPEGSALNRENRIRLALSSVCN